MHSLLQGFDKSVAGQIAKLPSWLLPLMTVCSFLGLPVVVVSVSLLVAVVCYLQDRKNVSTAFLLVVVALGANGVLKIIFQRARPETIYVQSMAIKSYSFPSGHSFGSIVFYGLIAYICYQHLSSPLTIIAPMLLALLILIIGVSRIFLGAHFPSDVVSGWLLGGVALAVIIKVCKL